MLMPGNGIELHETCGKILADILRKYVPEDEIEETKCIKMQPVQRWNWFKVL